MVFSYRDFGDFLRILFFGVHFFLFFEGMFILALVIGDGWVDWMLETEVAFADWELRIAEIRWNENLVTVFALGLRPTFHISLFEVWVIFFCQSLQALG